MSNGAQALGATAAGALRIAAAALIVWGTPAAAEAFVPVVVYDFGTATPLDKGFNEGVATGIAAFEARTGIDVREVLVEGRDTHAATIEGAIADGATAVLAVGFGVQEAVGRVALAHPDIEFTVLDAVVEGANVRSLQFEEQEGAFLVGMVAGAMSRTGTVGFVGGMDVPVINRFLAGFEAGVRHARPDATVLRSYVAADPPTAFGDLFLARSRAIALIDEGADVLFPAAGAASLGVHQAASERGVHSIGVDSNQNHLFPGTLLTSMLKRVDVAIEAALTDLHQGSWRPGVVMLGLESQGVDYAMDGYNSDLLSEDLVRDLEAARRAIVAGALAVPDVPSAARRP